LDRSMTGQNDYGPHGPRLQALGLSAVYACRRLPTPPIRGSNRRT
jgi:hypothetical protein